MLSSHLFWTSALWTNEPGSHIISPTSFCGACLTFYREKVSAVAFLVDRNVELLFTHELIVLHLLSIFVFFIFGVCDEEKSLFVGLRRDSNTCPNVKRFRGYQLNQPPGRPAYCKSEKIAPKDQRIDRFGFGSVYYFYE